MYIAGVVRAGFGGDIRLGKSGEHVSLSKAEERAHAYVSADPINCYLLSPFGLRTSREDPTFDLFRRALVLRAQVPQTVKRETGTK